MISVELDFNRYRIKLHGHNKRRPIYANNLNEVDAAMRHYWGNDRCIQDPETGAKSCPLCRDMLLDRKGLP